MRLSNEDSELSECKSTDIPEMMSYASDTSGRDDSVTATNGSGKQDTFWADDRFNTRRNTPKRERSQDSQSSESGSMQSDSSGSAFLNTSYNNSFGSGGWSSNVQGYGTRTHQSVVGKSPSSSPAHQPGSTLNSYYGDGWETTAEATQISYNKQSPRINLSKSFDQSLLIHAVRKQKALANYYDLKENATLNNNNYKSPHGMNRQYSLNDSNRPYPTRGPDLYEQGNPEDSVAPEVPPRQRRPYHLALTEKNLPTHSQSSHPFYVPTMGTELCYKEALPSHREPPPLPSQRSGYIQGLDNLHLDKKHSGDTSPRTLARERFKTRALSADFGTSKIPDFPCHRAALGEAITVSPAKSSNLLNGLNKSGPYSAPATPDNDTPYLMHAHPSNKSNYHPTSEQKRGILKSPGSVSKEHIKIIRSPTTTEKSTDLTLRARMKRSNSVPNNLDLWTDDEDDDENTQDSQSNNDDFGFRNHPKFKHVHGVKLTNGDISPGAKSDPHSTGMQKAKSPSTPRRILLKKWRKSKNTANSRKHVPQWKPEGGCLWSCKNGRQLSLTPTSLLTLSEVERLALQKVVHSKLQALELGCAIHIPKDWSNNKRSKKSTFSSLRKRTASTSALENKGKDSKDTGWVFGIPLGKCIANDKELRRRKPPPPAQDRRESLEITSPNVVRTSRKSSSSSVSVMDAHQVQGQGHDLRSFSVSHFEQPGFTSHHSSFVSGGAVSSDSLSEGDHRGQGSNLLDALSLSSSSRLEKGGSHQDESLLVPHIPQIPYVVSTCCRHLETYGLRVLGIFRIGSSKKRSKQLRDELDTGQDVKLNSEHNAHDVAALLKEYFRDLPDPLLTRDLYSAFVATRKMKSDDSRLQALHNMVCLLPAANRDTLWALLRFLNLVVQHSTDVTDDSGQLLPGNKMDSTNLATLFGPNILHKSKGGEFQVESLERAEERKDVIGVLKELIDKQSAIFQLSPELQDEVYRMLLDTNPEALDHILRKRTMAAQIMRSEGDHETSASSYYEDSECSSIPHSPGYSSENDTAFPRTFSEAMQMGAVPQVVTPAGPPTQQGMHLMHPDHGQMMYQTSTPPVTPQRTHKPAVRVSSDETQRSVRQADSTLKVPASYRLSAPDQTGWYRGDRSVSPASPRISPSPKAMKAGTPELRIRITKSDSPEQSLSGTPNVGPSPHTNTRRSVGIPHGPGPGGHRSKSHSAKNTLTVPVQPCSRSKSQESCTSIGSSSTGYLGGSSRSGTNSPMTPDPASTGHKWYLETPPDSPKEDDSSPLQRTSSTHRPLGFNVPKTLSVSQSSSSSSTLKAGSSPRPPRFQESLSTPSIHTKGASNQGNPPTLNVHPPRTDEAMDWQKEHWKHWEKLTRQHGEDFHEQETLV